MSEAKTTPQSSYTGPIVVDPLTRIEGHLRIEAEVENGRVKDARSCSTLFPLSSCYFLIPRRAIKLRYASMSFLFR